MAVTELAKPGDFMQTFTRANPTTGDPILYGITQDGKVYRKRLRGANPGGVWIDTGVTIPDVTIVADV
jgi:hypothetical protein